MHWAFPQAFVLLALLPLLWWPGFRRNRGAIALPAASSLGGRTTTWTRWAPRILKTLRLAACGCLIVALAGPQTASAFRHVKKEGIAIQIVLDTSLSMGFTDYVRDGQTISRMDAAKHAIRTFVAGDPRLGLPGRSDDLVGLVVFNLHPDVLCPLTTAHEALLSSLEEATLGPYTNIGDGLAWGLDRLRRAPVREKVLILVSDGKHNVPNAINPITAAKLAADLGIRIYTIGAIGNQDGTAAPGLLRGQIGDASADSVDEPTLKRIASLTGGRYFRATDTDGLLAICREIDRLEKSPIRGGQPLAYQDWYPLPLALALILLAAEALLGATRFRLLGG